MRKNTSIKNNLISQGMCIATDLKYYQIILLNKFILGVSGELKLAK